MNGGILPITPVLLLYSTVTSLSPQPGHRAVSLVSLLCEGQACII